MGAMDVFFERADFDEPQLAVFLQAHLDDTALTAPPESCHALDLDALRNPNVQLWVGRSGTEIVVTAALVQLEPGHEELKSMRTDPAHRGQGIARKMLEMLIADARERGVKRISLETGSMDFFAPARRLYAAVGFVACEPFGDYTDDPSSTYLTNVLTLTTS